MVTRLLVFLGVVLTALGAFARDASRGVLDANAMADRTAASLSDPRVANYVADQLTDAVLAQKPDLTAFRPVIAATATGLVQTPPFRAVVRAAVRAAHTSAFSTTGRRVLLSMPDVGMLIRSAVESMSPEMAEKIPSQLQAFAANLGSPERLATVQRVLRIIKLASDAAVTLLIIGPLLIVLGVGFAVDRRRALLRAGIGLMIAALILAALIPAGRIAASLATPEPLERGAIFGLWRGYFGGLLDWAIMLGGIGLLVTAAATSLLEAADPVNRARWVIQQLATPPAPPGLLAMWSAAMTIIGVLAIVFPLDAAAGVTMLAGVGLSYVGIRELFRQVLAAIPEETAAQANASAREPWLSRRLVVVTVLLLTLGGAVVAVARPGRREMSSGAMQCNGSTLLCDRRLDAVAFPATHNSMANVDMPNWMFPQQNASILRQLNDGIRGLLIDVHTGVPVEGIVKTDLGAEAQSAQKIAYAVGDSATAAAIRIRDRLTGTPSGPPALYLCHGFCEIGSALLEPELGQIRNFLRAHPEEVVVMVIEDYAPPDTIAAAFVRAGLGDLVYRGPMTTPLPTLRSLIEAGTPLVVYLESGTPGVPWLYPAFEGTVMETPYTFHNPAEFSCAPNRGGTSAPIFQVNHWIESTPAPKPSNAAIVNSYDFLLDRAQRCMKERKHLPNILAVDFYRVGDLFGVVRNLNGLTGGLSAATMPHPTLP